MMDVAANLAAEMKNREMSDIISADYLILKQDPALLKKLLKQINPENMNILLSDPEFDESKATEEEQYYQIKIQKEEIKKSSIDVWKKALSGEDWQSLPKGCKIALHCGKVPALQNVPTKDKVTAGSSGVFPTLLTTFSVMLILF